MEYSHFHVELIPSYFFFIFSTSGSTPVENQHAHYAEIFFEKMIIEFYILQIAF